MVVRQRPYRVPEAHRQAIEEEVKQMLREGIIEESASQLSSPTVVVPKPDGSLRLCNDFWRLNQISEFDSYPLPKVALAPNAKPKTPFTTSGGHWQYRVLPFGLHGAPATFQHLMDMDILQPYRTFTAAYLDNILIHSST
ncbi:hypothetical protein QTP70_010202 [Hemibagrus guttatus]|uniref:ribonuclease H n=1 Tax=Hemibagrus guttatus TaxID=175788 RepID=A0AAE0UIF2_9TELE|nr:hypothetical protein QTP70_010202 [Hemibagrus guttatus]KAK3522893.1 hypothetical protein QTP86_007325 [Hemibagrus guttatus]